MKPSVIALLHGPDQPGIVAKVATWIHQRGGNVLHADQHLDRQENVFFQRVEWEPDADRNLQEESDEFISFVERELTMQVRIALSEDRPKVAIMVSKADHCFHDLVLRVRAGEWNAEFVGVLSNHQELQSVSESYGLPFVHIPVNQQNKVEVEQRQISWLREQGVELVILARYMQILSSEFLQQVSCPVINIHHSFLPSFAGAKPYHQAYQRGVKLIGATAHYVTEDLDEGPIIEQDVARVSHRHGPRELIEKGRDLEKLVLATAVRRHLQNRVLDYQNKTVVFD
ncbi:MAG: formyltetrahydrofolate deformylase [Puniceicoccaceae bacterium]|nr:formyltetrahydrofolate deformylase [Puniceicoccaceae bacterium]|tara:strand:+ start:4394 stop:5248 length:855 start_codon:yes stop_codon:yes gene_type:complete